MTSKAALFALLTVWGVGSGSLCLPAMAEDAVAEEATLEDTPDDNQKPTISGLTDRVWTKSEDDGVLPGDMKIFLSDGTLVQDSCWETHRLSNWQAVSDTDLRWNEDGMDVTATIVSLENGELVLAINGDEATYVTASVPYVCPDFPKS
ncbi:hypothetical protein [Devosia sp.]|uniref:hypothetical protein n=1 Tax=Devosia sp. TaxID=1871048 RepID=UPI003A9377EF